MRAMQRNKYCVPFEDFIVAIAKQMCEGKTEQEIEDMWMELDEWFKAIKEHKFNNEGEDNTNDD